jgi:membrane-bound lytic murein transglycosylase F
MTAKKMLWFRARSRSRASARRLALAACIALAAALTQCESPRSDTPAESPAHGTDSSRDSANVTPDSQQSMQADRTAQIAPDPDIKKNPVLRNAYASAAFDPRQWLKSDRAFLGRPHPGRISKYDRIIKKMARRYGFDWRLIAAQIYAESNFRNQSRSHAGAVGLMQVLPSTAEFMGTDPNALLTPEVNIAVGCMYDQRMYSLWGRQTKDRHQRLAFALASYNAGRGRVLRSWRKADSARVWSAIHPALPEETQSYVHKIYLKWNQYRNHVIP